ncbi:MAG: hypothetical protein LC100_11315 [Chitinophagales bacterium]|nr:hypothetical protein [Chitinophagales bacterium]
MAKIKGKNVLVQILKNDVWTDFGCAISVSLDVTTEMIETSEKGAGKFATFLPSKISFTGSLSGYVDLTKLSLKEFREYQLAGTRLKMIWKRTEGADTYTESAEFFVINTHDEASYIGFNSYTVDLQGTGVLTLNQDFSLTPYDYKFGKTNIDTSLPYFNDAAKWNAIITSIETANSTSDYTTGTCDDVSYAVEINYSVFVGYSVLFFIFPSTVSDFTLWDEVDILLQQNILISSGSSGVWRKDVLSTGEKVIATRYQTAFTNPINFHR